jgi:mannan endo-1,4-beta-mannosidase
MKSVRIFSVLAIAAALLLCSCQAQKPSFVKVEDGKFVSEDYPSHYVGTNFWYGAILGSEGRGGNRARLEAELDTLKALGITNLRVLVGGDGPDGIPTRVTPNLQMEPGVYNDTIFWGLDYLLAEMGERNMKAVLFINNSWEWSGGYGMYLEWAGAGKSLIPAEVGYGPFMESVSHFVTNDKAKELFYNHVRHVVSRTNTVTGKAYKDDPAIFSWQIGNEPRCFRSDSLGQAAFVDFMWTTASLIKSIDPNHMVSSGSEGSSGCEGSLELWEKIHSCPDIDYTNIHIWPYNWGWVKENSLDTNLPQAIANTDEYIDNHIKVAAKYGKPVVLEEFGFPRDGFQFRKGSPVSSRDEYYRHVFGRIVEAAEEGGLFAGLNFWGWGGLASQSETNLYWQPGDDYCGDPGQEQQGLNSVYACDASTVAVIKEATDAIAKALLPDASFDLEDNDGIYLGEGPFTILVKCGEGAAKSLELEINTDFGEPVGTYGYPFNVSLEPGFYKAVLYQKAKDGSRVEMDRSNLGFNPEKISSPQDRQADFDEFWNNTLEELAAVDMDAKLTPLKEYSNEVRKAYRVDMKSLGGEPVCGVLSVPVTEGKYPVMVSYMGYDSGMWYPDPSSNPQRIDFLMCIRKQALNKKPGENSDWCARGLESKETYYYRGAFADAVRAVDFVCSLENADTERIFANGESQGGALTFAAAALTGKFKAIAAGVPFLGDYKDYFALVNWPGEPILKAAREGGISDEDLYRTLSYFDMKNFTDKIQCPVIMAIGLQDDVCPPHTNFAAYNQLQCEKSWLCYPRSGHSLWLEPRWAEARDDFFEKFL